MTNICPVFGDPPVAPFYSAEQMRFMRLHKERVITSWRWVFGYAQLRASDGYDTATISAQALDDLIRDGFMIRGAGCAEVYLTELGRMVVA